ncbi:uncharacterized protein PFLUO_LOCUS7347 [Penicillium psychrofluorescens]|uniref:uncharacterized protein n=1 Tax=Penicillium psychrofluorescens TaxID=3158075 RepID=UPI003CCDD4C0
MAEPDTHSQRRSSSQASSVSSRSQTAKTLRGKAQKRHSGSNTPNTPKTPTDLTSFPSLSPPNDTPNDTPTLTRGLSNTLLTGYEGGGAGETTRGRKATLARLTSGLSNTSDRAALFEDSVPTRDIPGALHLVDDAHIERLIANTGAAKIVRQFARDLAQRDAEISALRQRADARERELKRMLREVSVSSQDIERRLYQLENSPQEDRKSDGESSNDWTAQSSGLNGLMSQAMTDAVGSRLYVEPPSASEDLQSTIRAQRSENDTGMGGSSTDSSNTRKRQSSGRSWQDYIFGSTSASRKTSRASSVKSDMEEIEEENTERLHVPSNPARRKALDEQLFQPPGTQPSGGSGRRIASATTNGDDASIHSRKSSRSMGSWTVKLFAGQSAKDSSDSETNRNQTSGNQVKDKANPSTFSASSKGGMSAVAALKRINSNASLPTPGGRSATGSTGTSKMNPSTGRRSAAGSFSQGGPPEAVDRSSTNLGPVEMDAILPIESRPPTLTQTYNNSQSGEFLTDRFGFIYDQRRKKRQREANALKSSSRPLSISETLGSRRSDASDPEDDIEIPQALQTATATQSSTPLSPEDPDSGSVGLRRWQDYLKMPSRPTELLSHTPSTAPIISLMTAGDSRPHSSSGAMDKNVPLSVNSSAQPSVSTSAVTAGRPELAGVPSDETTTANTSARATATDTEPVKLLLEQLTDLHDTLQRDRTVRWNEFLRKVRAERRKEGEAAAAAAASDRTVTTVDTPEATLADGEVIGIAGLGNKGKVGRAKWREFRSLVLGGIPVALRAKVWSECSGASAMRIPGYYDDLVREVGGSEPDSSVVAQIDMDIRRTLTDNVFFRKGPGVPKLKEVLLAYSRRNPEVGYCQGMNLIAASLLLIMPTPEDAFWILTSMIEVILPQHYYDHGLLASRADQMILRQYISELLPRLSAHLEELGIELEALTFQWFLSLFTDCLSAEALYRVWDVVLCLNVTSAVANGPVTTAFSASSAKEGGDKISQTAEDDSSGSGGGSTFLFQVALALLKLNEQQLLTTCSTPAALYTYINHQMTNHAISIDGLIQASEALRNVVRREDVVSRRATTLQEMRDGRI